MSDESLQLTEEEQDDGPRVDPHYWNLAREPLACLVFLLPLLLLYEAGVVWLEQNTTRSIRNGADYWMRTALNDAGIDAFVLPAGIIGILLIWHRYGGYPWRLSRDTLVGMFGESLLLAVCLLFVAQIQDMAFQCWLPGEITIRGDAAGERPVLSIDAGQLGPRLISYVGAGVYEELMFRLGLQAFIHPPLS